MNPTTTSAVLRAIVETIATMDQAAGAALAERLAPVREKAKQNGWPESVAEVDELIVASRP